ncbi:MAG: protein kinase domain-containing protein [Myxococcota bacterium]
MVDHQDERDTIKVLDFGLVKSVKGTNADTMTTGGICVGSPSYMAPEQVDGDEVSPATDIYSLGAVLFEMLCGRPPFVKASKYALVMAHLSEQPPSLSDFMQADKIPAGLDDVVARCLEKEPKDRFANLDEFLSELQRIGRGKAPLSTTMMRLRRSGSGPQAGVASGEQPVATVSETPAATSTGASVLSAGQSSVQPAPKRTGLWVAAIASVLVLGGTGGYFALASGDNDGQAASTPSAAIAQDDTSGESSAAHATAHRASSATASAPAATTRDVRIESTPRGAKVQDDETGEALCASTPCDASVPLGQDGRAQAHEVKLTLAGYRTTTVKVGPSEEVVKVELRRIVVGSPPAAPPKQPPPKKTGGGFELSPY